MKVFPGKPPYNLVTRFADDGYNLFTVKMIVRPDASKFPDRYQAMSCSLHPSVNTYTTRIEKNMLEEELIHRAPLGYKMQNRISTHDHGYLTLATSHAFRNGSREPCDRREHPAPGYVEIGQTNIEAAPSLSQSKVTDQKDRLWYLPEDCVWQFGFIPYFSIQNKLRDISDRGTVYVGLPYNSGSSHLRKLYRDGNMTLDTVNELFGDLAASMTTVVRSNPADNQTWPVHGTMWYTTTCTRVNWYWILYPVIMVGLCAAFLVLVHIESRGVDAQRLWKSSTLAMLFCEMDEAVVAAARPLQKDAMRDVARSTGVGLGTDTDGLRLVAK